MIIAAKFASVCPCCSARIEVGSKVEWSKGSKARHVACEASAPVSATATVSVDPLNKPGRARGTRRSFPRRGSYGWDGVVGSSSYYTSGQYDEEP